MSEPAQIPIRVRILDRDYPLRVAPGDEDYTVLLGDLRVRRPCVHLSAASPARGPRPGARLLGLRGRGRVLH